DAACHAYSLGRSRSEAPSHLDPRRLRRPDEAFPIDRDAHPRLRRIVEAFAVAKVLVPHGDTHAPFESLAVADVTGAARQQHRIAIKRGFFGRKREVLQSEPALAHRGDAHDWVPGR